jgi:DNA-binding HxlR family transcriptional regulator
VTLDPESLAFRKSNVSLAPVTRSRRTLTAPARSPCPVAGSLDLIGDRWTLLVVRDLFWGKRRYGEFLASPEAIPTNILAARLVRLKEAGLVNRTRYQDRPPRFGYTLTRRGRDLQPVLAALLVWGKRHVPGTWTREEIAAQKEAAGKRREPARRALAAHLHDPLEFPAGERDHRQAAVAQEGNAGKRRLRLDLRKRYRTPKRAHGL